jgi:predicted nucleic acid-binding protein
VSTFADSSALVKLYVPEEGHTQVRRVRAIAIAQIARVEVPAAFWRKHRLGELSADNARLLTAAFEADYFGTDQEPPRFVALALRPEVLDEATRLCASHGLRACDGVQLACAECARRADPECSTVAAFDGALRSAAAREGFALLPATL